MLGKPYYEIDVRDLQRAVTSEDGAAWRALSSSEQMEYIRTTKAPRDAWRKHCRDAKVQRSFKTQALAEKQASKMKGQFPHLDFVVRELTPVFL